MLKSSNKRASFLKLTLFSIQISSKFKLLCFSDQKNKVEKNNLNKNNFGVKL